MCNLSWLWSRCAAKIYQCNLVFFSSSIWNTIWWNLKYHFKTTCITFCIKTTGTWAILDMFQMIPTGIGHPTPQGKSAFSLPSLIHSLGLKVSCGRNFLSAPYPTRASKDSPSPLERGKNKPQKNPKKCYLQGYVFFWYLQIFQFLHTTKQTVAQVVDFIIRKISIKIQDKFELKPIARWNIMTNNE